MPPLRRSVGLREHHARDRDRLGERAGLCDAILARLSVENEQGLVDLRTRLLDDPLDLAELVHQGRLRVQPTGGVDDQHVGASRRCRLHGVECHRSGVGAAVLAHEVRTGAGRPDRELLPGRRPERVGRRQAHLLALSGEAFRELADRRRLARAVDADHHHDAGAVRRQMQQLVGSEHRDDLIAEQRNWVGAGRVVRLDARHEIGGALRPHVGLDQQVFELAPSSVAHAALEQRLDLGTQALLVEDAA